MDYNIRNSLGQPNINQLQQAMVYKELQKRSKVLEKEADLTFFTGADND